MELILSPRDIPMGAFTVFTIGHGARAPDEFLDMLQLSGVESVVDVRAQPASRRHPHFSRAPLEALLRTADIAYEWEGAALGGFRKVAPGSRHRALDNAGFRGYADHMETADFRAGVARVIERAVNSPVALLCAEQLPQHCHRSFIADSLTCQGVRVAHLLGAGQETPHRLNTLARVENGWPVYDRGDGRQLDLALL